MMILSNRSVCMPPSSICANGVKSLWHTGSKTLLKFYHGRGEKSIFRLCQWDRVPLAQQNRNLYFSQFILYSRPGRVYPQHGDKRRFLSPCDSFFSRKRAVNMKNSTIYLIGAVILGAWFILPDPIPLVADDVLAALGGAAAAVLYYRSRRNE